MTVYRRSAGDLLRCRSFVVRHWRNDRLAGRSGDPPAVKPTRRGIDAPAVASLLRRRVAFERCQLILEVLSCLYQCRFRASRPTWPDCWRPVFTRGAMPAPSPGAIATAADQPPSPRWERPSAGRGSVGAAPGGSWPRRNSTSPSAAKTPGPIARNPGRSNRPTGRRGD